MGSHRDPKQSWTSKMGGFPLVSRFNQPDKDCSHEKIKNKKRRTGALMKFVVLKYKNMGIPPTVEPLARGPRTPGGQKGRKRKTFGWPLPSENEKIGPAPNAKWGVDPSSRGQGLDTLPPLSWEDRKIRRSSHFIKVIHAFYPKMRRTWGLSYIFKAGHPGLTTGDFSFFSGNTVDGRNPAPPKRLWRDDSPVNTNKQWFPMVSKWCRFCPSTVSCCFCGFCSPL